MKKKVIIVFGGIVLSLLICAFLANEYFKIVAQNAIDTYLKTLKGEFDNELFQTSIDEITCKGFVNYICHIEYAHIKSNDIDIALKDISVAISNISYDRVEVKFDVNSITNLHKIKHNTIIPQKFSYILNIIKQDSTLGYISLNRHLNFGFSDFVVQFDLDVLLRERIFMEKNILAILREWFDNTTPSFYEYSLDLVKVDILSNGKVNLKDKDAFYRLLLEYGNEVFLYNYTKAYYTKFLANFMSLLDGESSQITLLVDRKNDDLIFFEKLSREARLKKILEVKQILQSINQAYKIKITNQ